MPRAPGSGTEPAGPMVYEIRIKGHLGSRWHTWFDHMEVAPRANGETTLTGPVVDQAELHGVLTRLRDMGLRLVSVTEVEPAQGDGLPLNKERS